MKKTSAVSVFLLLSWLSLYANGGDMSVVVEGKIENSTSVRLTPRQIEKTFRIFKANIYNPWEKKSAHYEGVLLDQFAKKLASTSVQRVRLKAIDDYEVSLDRTMWQKERILLVTKINGKYLSVKEKGPMLIVFVDYDDSKAKNLHLWMWMIKQITFE
jgi:hypothetical protein